MELSIKNHQKHTIHLQNALPWLIIIFMPIFYWLLSRQYSGPAYLADEIGYLAKASFLAGYLVDGSSSYYPGYALLLSPLFIILKNPNQIWQGVLVVNASLWGFSFFLLWKLIVSSAPNSTFTQRFFALLLSSLYPSFVTMSGYAFPSSFLAFIFLLSLSLLARWKPGEMVKLLPFSVIVGLYYWVHPTGLAVILASTIVIAFLSIRIKKIMPLFIHIGIVLFLLVTCNIFTDWINESMTPAGQIVNTHYPGMDLLTASIGSARFWTSFVGLSLGQISSLIINSFGVIVFVLPQYLRNLSDICLKNRRNEIKCGQPAILYMGLSVLLVIAVGSWGFATSTTLRIDKLLYGRYVESLFPAMLAFGYVSYVKSSVNTRRKVAIFCLLLVFSAGVFIDILIPFLDTELSSLNNMMNLPSFWPQYLLDYSSYLLWFSVGLIGILIAIAGGKYMPVLLMILSLIFGYTNQSKWHSQILEHYSRPSSFVDLVRSNFAQGKCIGFDDRIAYGVTEYKEERYNLYQYYLYDYDYRRMSTSEWQSNCNGPYLTYESAEFYGYDQINIVAKEYASELLLIIKEDPSSFIIPNTVIARNDLFVSQLSGTKCFISGCFRMNAAQLSQLKQVGVLKSKNLVSTNQHGFLFYGPYYQLLIGGYYLVLNGEFEVVSGAILDITSSNGQTTLYKAHLSDFLLETGQPLVLPFNVVTDVKDLEIRLWVSEIDKISISSYDVILAQESNLRPTNTR